MNTSGNLDGRSVLEGGCTTQTATGSIYSEPDYANVLNSLRDKIYQQNVNMGWYTNIETGEPLERNQGEMLLLIISEIVEGFEGIRKNLMDDHLPQYPMICAEMGDSLIRILDFCGYHNLDIGHATVDKIAYNANRADHKVSNRKEANGKKF